jgi:hypothetical protein
VQDRRDSPNERFNNHNWVEVYNGSSWSFTGMTCHEFDNTCTVANVALLPASSDGSSSSSCLQQSQLILKQQQRGAARIAAAAQAFLVAFSKQQSKLSVRACLCTSASIAA